MKRIDKLIEEYVDIRNKRKALDQASKNIKKHMDKLEDDILKHCDEQNVESYKTTFGTAYKIKQEFVSVKNFDATFDFIVANDLRHLLTKSVKKSSALEYMRENNNQLPPGLEYIPKTKIGVTAGKGEVL